MKKFKVLSNLIAVALLAVSICITFSEGINGNVTVWNFIGLVGMIASLGWLDRDAIKDITK